LNSQSCNLALTQKDDARVVPYVAADCVAALVFLEIFPPSALYCTTSSLVGTYRVCHLNTVILIMENEGQVYTVAVCAATGKQGHEVINRFQEFNEAK